MFGLLDWLFGTEKRSLLVRWICLLVLATPLSNITGTLFNLVFIVAWGFLMLALIRDTWRYLRK